MKSSNARFLVMGGQACVLYGAADFSRDLDLAIGMQPGDVQSITDALRALKAEKIFFPPLEAQSLARGHACHYRCFAPGVEELRIDLMATMRGCDPFEREADCIYWAPLRAELEMWRRQRLQRKQE
ncbi:MAG: hypothetical protein NTX50_13490 [Candidatus Sumerlaeota bacterium]|nr:hypothetical protein [Candidatus Sumerlaeota bacterium]